MANSNDFGNNCLLQEKCRHLMEKKKHSEALPKWKVLLKDSDLPTIRKLIILCNIIVCCIFDENDDFDETKEIEKVSQTEWLKIRNTAKEHTHSLEKMGCFLEAFIWMKIIFKLDPDGNEQNIFKQGKRIMKKTAENEKNTVGKYVITFLEETLRKLPADRDKKMLPQLLMKLGQCYEIVRDYKGFFSYTEKAQQALEMCYGQECQNYKIYGKILNNLGVAHMLLGRFKEAEHALIRSEASKQKAKDYVGEIEKEKCISKTQQALSRVEESRIAKTAKCSTDLQPLPPILQTSVQATLRKSSSIKFDECVVSFRTSAFAQGEQLQFESQYKWSDVPDFHIPISPVLYLKPKNLKLKRDITVELPTWGSTTRTDFKVKLMAKSDGNDKEWQEIKHLVLGNDMRVTFQVKAFMIYGIFLDTKAYLSSLFSTPAPVLIHLSILLYHKNRRSFAVLLCFQNAASVDECRETMERAGYQDALPPGEDLNVPLGGTVTVRLACNQPAGIANQPEEYEFTIRDNLTTSHVQKYSHLSRNLQPQEDLHLDYRITATGNTDIRHPILLQHEEPRTGVNVQNMIGSINQAQIDQR